MSQKLNHPRVLLALEWYSQDIYRGIAAFAKEAGWVLDMRMMLNSQLSTKWQGDGVICKSFLAL